MDLSTQTERWATWAVQARNFAKRQNFTDALARMKLVHSSISEALAEASDEGDKARLRAHLAVAEEELAELQTEYDAWHSEIAERRQHTIESAAEEMARPIPSASE